MAQISIPMSNKVGYSMYWNSMWDNKINYTKNLKEDIYLKKIIPFFFNDKISINLLKFKNYKYKYIDIDRYYMHYNFDKINKNFINFLYKNNDIEMYPSKLWIVRYQKWVILFYFLYIPNFKKLNKFNIKVSDFNMSYFFNYYSFYSKANIKLSYSYDFFKNSKKNYNF